MGAPPPAAAASKAPAPTRARSRTPCLSVDTLVHGVQRLVRDPLLGPGICLLAAPLLASLSAAAVLVWVSLVLPFGTLSRSALALLPRWPWRRRPTGRMDQPFAWSGEVVLVTGAAHGVGRELVELLLARTDVKLVIACDVVPCPMRHDRLKSYILDISNRVFVRKVMDRIIQQHGHPTALVNCAAIARGKPVAQLTEQELEKTIGVNLTGTLYVIKCLLPGMERDNYGHIVTLASVMGMSGVARMADYAASEAGLIAFHEALRQELHERPGNAVHVSLLTTGHVRTGLLEGMMSSYPFWLPSLSVSAVASTIQDVLAARTHHDLVLPVAGRIYPLLRLLPMHTADRMKRAWALNADTHKFRATRPPAVDVTLPRSRSPSASPTGSSSTTTTTTSATTISSGSPPAPSPLQSSSSFATPLARVPTPEGE